MKNKENELILDGFNWKDAFIDEICRKTVFFLEDAVELISKLYGDKDVDSFVRNIAIDVLAAEKTINTLGVAEDKIMNDLEELLGIERSALQPHIEVVPKIWISSYLKEKITEVLFRDKEFLSQGEKFFLENLLSFGEENRQKP